MAKNIALLALDGEEVEVTFSDAENKAAQSINNAVDAIWDNVIEINKIAFNVAHSAVRYLELSTKK